jgi:aquaporin SIP
MQTYEAAYFLGKKECRRMKLRFFTQAVGAVGGVLAVRELIPSAYKHLLRGPRLMVGLNTGILAEFVLTSVITFSVLFAVLKGPRSPVLKTSIIVLATYAVVLLGAGFTGPSLNPAHVSTQTQPSTVFSTHFVTLPP